MRCARAIACSGKCGGFTLVELLIAITLLGLIAVVTYSSVWTAGRSLRAVESRVEVSEESRVILQFLRQALTQARGVMAIHEQRMRVVFDGETHSIAFVAPAPLQRGNAGGLYRYRLSLNRRVSDEQALQLSYWQYFAGEKLDPGQQPLGTTLLSRRIEKLTLAYFGPGRPDEEAEWHDEWRRPDTLPQLVRITLHSDTAERPYSMTVAIKGRVG